MTKNTSRYFISQESEALLCWEFFLRFAIRVRKQIQGFMALRKDSKLLWYRVIFCHGVFSFLFGTTSLIKVKAASSTCFRVMSPYTQISKSLLFCKKLPEDTLLRVIFAHTVIRCLGGHIAGTLGAGGWRRRQRRGPDLRTCGAS